MFGKEEGIGLNHTHLAEVGSVNWVGSIEVDCLQWLAFDLHSEGEVPDAAITFTSS